MLRNLINLPIGAYIKQIYLPLGRVIITSIILPISIHCMMNEGLMRFLTVGFISVLSVGSASFFLGLNSNERHFLLEKIKIKIKS